MSYLIDEGDLAELAHGNAAERERDWIKIWVQPIHKPSFFFFFFPLFWQPCQIREGHLLNGSSGLVETLITKENALFCGDLQKCQGDADGQRSWATLTTFSKHSKYMDGGEALVPRSP